MQFFDFANKKGGYINIDTRSLKYLPRVVGYTQPKMSPALKPHVCQKKIIEPTHKELGLDYSWGGWLENRSNIWRGCYMAKDNKYIHLGYDFNLPVGTRICASRPCEVLDIYTDTPEEHGWGTRIIVRLLDERMYLIYAHLDLLGPNAPRVGQELRPGYLIGTIAPPERNGGWYSHVHWQGMSEEANEEFRRDPASLDGYGKVGDEARLARLYPDPMRFVSFK